MKASHLAGLVIVVLMAGSAIAAEPAAAPAPARRPAIEGGFPPTQQFEGLPAFREQALALDKVPKATGPRVSLFNGRDLDQFTPWLGYANGSAFPAGPGDAPLGETGIGDVFRVVTEDGKPAIFISGKVWGAIHTRQDLRDYHLSLWYKFGRQLNPQVPINSGVLYHSYGAHGAFAGTWKSAVEFEIASGITGLVVTIGSNMTAETEIAKGPGRGVFGGDDLRYMAGGKRAEIHLPTMVKPNRYAELPPGQWNKLDLYVVGDQAVHVVNDVPAVAVSRIAVKGSDGVVRPLTHGPVQLQSEGTEMFIRDIWYEPIGNVPEVISRGEGR